MVGLGVAAAAAVAAFVERPNAAVDGGIICRTGPAAEEVIGVGAEKGGGIRAGVELGGGSDSEPSPRSRT